MSCLKPPLENYGQHLAWWDGFAAGCWFCFALTVVMVIAGAIIDLLP